jgi:hypothetical protein
MLHKRGKAYSQDLRERVFATADEGARVGQIAGLLRVSVSYVSKASAGGAKPESRQPGRSDAMCSPGSALCMMRRGQMRPSPACGLGFSKRTRSAPATG